SLRLDDAGLRGTEADRAQTGACRRVAPSYDSARAQRREAVSSDDQVIHELDVAEVERVLHLGGEIDVVVARSRLARRVVVIEHHSDGVIQQRILNDVARGDESVIDRPDEYLALLDEPILSVE